MSDLFESPGSRNEAILQNMLGANNPLEPPGSRIEDLLQQLLEEGSGSGLPDVTDADNGKVLGVENGAWGAVENKFIKVILFDPTLETYFNRVLNALMAEAKLNGTASGYVQLGGLDLLDYLTDTVERSTFILLINVGSVALAFHPKSLTGEDSTVTQASLTATYIDASSVGSGDIDIWNIQFDVGYAFTSLIVDYKAVSEIPTS